jgi:uncharacterized protein YndB with AHSA1/START domain
MSENTLTKKPVVEVQMLIRRPAEEVFRAFVDPAVTTRFWFTKSSGELKEGAEVTWEWEMYDISNLVRVHEVVPNSRIKVEWNLESPSVIEWKFEEREDGTFVTITESELKGEGDELVAYAIDSSKGFTFVLAGLKALLEHDVELNLVADYT